MMDNLNSNNNGVPASSYDVLSFERKLVELVEELRLKRNIEVENEKSMKSLMDEKYKAELEWDEKQSRLLREKADLEQQILLLKRKLDQNFCVSDDEKTKQRIVNKTYSQEIRALKEELRSSNSEKLSLLKRIQELEGQLKLHTNFQETIVSQIGDIRKRTRTLTDEWQALDKAHKNVMDNVSEAKSNFKKFDISNQHLKQCIAIAERNSEMLKKELITIRTEAALFKNTSVSTNKTPETCTDVNKLLLRISELDNLLLLSRKENQKTLQNFVESNNQLNKYINKYANAQTLEKSLTTKLRDSSTKLHTSQHYIDELLEEVKRLKDYTVTEKKLKEDRKTVETQTHEKIIDLCGALHQTDSSQMHERSGTHSHTEKCHSFEILPNLDVTFQNSKTTTSLNTKIEESRIEKDPPMRCDLVNEIGIFGETIKRKFDAMEERDVLPLKKRIVENTIEVDTSWGINLEFKQRFIDDDGSIQSSANSIPDCLCRSQDTSIADKDAIKDAMPIVEETDQEEIKKRGVEMSDLASVQLNLKELKVNDGCGGLPQDK